MATNNDHPYLYLTTTGHRTGSRHEIEIWYIAYGDCYYLVSERRERSHWVQNIQHNSAISFRVGETTYQGQGRIILVADEPQLARSVKQLMDTKYNWSEGLIVELCPA